MRSWRRTVERNRDQQRRCASCGQKISSGEPDVIVEGQATGATLQYHKRRGRGRPQAELADIKGWLSELAEDVLASETGQVE